MEHDILQVYREHQGACHLIIFLVLFGGMGRIAFWSRTDGLRVGGMLALGLALLLSVALITWADETGRRISEVGPWAAFLVAQAILILGWRTFTKSRDI